MIGLDSQTHPMELDPVPQNEIRVHKQQKGMIVGIFNQQYLLLKIIFHFSLLLPQKTKPIKQIKMPCSFFSLPSTQNSTFADLTPLPQLARERRVTLSTVPSDCTGSQVCLLIQFSQMPLPVSLQQSQASSSACQRSLAGSADLSCW